MQRHFKKVHTINFSSRKILNSVSKVANWISICNSTGRSEIWDKFHEL